MNGLLKTALLSAGTLIASQSVNAQQLKAAGAAVLHETENRVPKVTLLMVTAANDTLALECDPKGAAHVIIGERQKKQGDFHVAYEENRFFLFRNEKDFSHIITQYYANLVPYSQKRHGEPMLTSYEEGPKF